MDDPPATARRRHGTGRGASDIAIPGGIRVASRPHPTRLHRLFVREHEPQIALAALTRLRWLAVVGQIAATAVAVAVLRLNLPLVPMGLGDRADGGVERIVVVEMRRDARRRGGWCSCCCCWTWGR